MHFSTPTVTLALMGTIVSAQQWTLKDDYFSTGDFFDYFSFFEGADPTDGNVTFVDRDTAYSSGLASNTASSAYMGIDHDNVTPDGRPAIRVYSNYQYSSGLIIADIAHMPGSICGVWPAFWMVGPNPWPSGGEIDIIEGVNTQTTNDMTLHTEQGCTIQNNGAFSGSINTYDCWVDDPQQSKNAGCQITTDNTATYGDGFNSNGGGVYATQIDQVGNAITIWFFPRGSIPSDITNGNPTISNWGEPIAQFADGCNVEQYFSNLAITFDITLCGQWAGSVWGSNPTCAALDATCGDYVLNNPNAFADAYWTVNGLKVYMESSAASGSAAVAGNSTLRSSGPGWGANMESN